jgi:hypothetical protein
MALIGSRANHRTRSRTNSGITRIFFRTRISIIAGRSIRFDGIAAYASNRVTKAHGMALIGCSADDRYGAGTNSTIACIHLRAAIAVITDRAIGLDRIGTHARARIAHSNVVALIHRDTFDWICAETSSSLTRIHWRAGIAVITRSAIWFPRIGTRARGGITRSRRMALAHDEAYDWVCPVAKAVLATIGLRASIAVITNAAARFLRIGTYSGCWIANARIVALAESRTYDWVCPCTHARLTSIRLRTSIAVVTSVTGEQLTYAVAR